jgi:hypothetical protein
LDVGEGDLLLLLSDTPTHTICMDLVGALLFFFNSLSQISINVRQITESEELGTYYQ